MELGVRERTGTLPCWYGPGDTRDGRDDVDLLYSDRIERGGGRRGPVYCVGL